MSDSIPKVSICVPNLNTRPYLPERFDSIFNQTFQDFEVIVYDSHSDDGAWEYIQQVAARDPRVRAFQGPREKPPACWNPALREARGEYVYIATSDDTMMPDCLEKMVAALEENPDCGLCQCGLVIIDEKSNPFPPQRQWDLYTLGAFSQEMVKRKNKRMAPHDGILHSALFTIYTSITQLLIRKKVFDRIGLFEGTWGPISDYEWGMRAGLLENCIYIPDKLATWRLHAAQATQDVHTLKNRVKMIEMVRAALARAQEVGGGLKNINANDLVYFLARDMMEMGPYSGKGLAKQLPFIMAQMAKHPGAVLSYIGDRVAKRHWDFWNCESRYDRLKRMLKRYDIPSPVYE